MSNQTKTVYVLIRRDPWATICCDMCDNEIGYDDYELRGVFDSEEKAKEVRTTFVTKWGFQEKDFEIRPMELNKLQ